jgi:hypothetical protein
MKLETGQQTAVNEFLEDLTSRANATFEKGNRVGAAYLAEICGMWTNALNQPNKNPFQESWLYRWFGHGYEDFAVATRMSVQLTRKMLEKEKYSRTKKK